jgi:diaminopimelate epimerase
MRSSKWHALGNTYLLLEAPELTRERAIELARGTDGIVQVVSSEEAEAEVVIWNPDGSTAELSGNGVRIAARWLAERADAAEVRIRVGSRVVNARLLNGEQVETDLGSFRVGAPETVDGVDLVPVDVGNPHAVVLGDPSEILSLGPRLEAHPRFPQRTNVQVARIDRPGRVSARVWERGVGETSASGTSAVAVAAATHGEGDVVVRFPGGDLLVRLRNGRATVVGPAEEIGPADLPQPE